MEENAGFGLCGGSVAEVVDVAVGTQAADDRGTGWGVDGLTLGANRNLAVVADAHPAALAPDVGPPGAVGRRTDGRAFFGDGLVVGLARGGPEFAVDFVVVWRGGRVGPGVGWLRPTRMVLPAGQTGRPCLGAALRAGPGFFVLSAHQVGVQPLGCYVLQTG